jgi:hypothetical protein
MTSKTRLVLVSSTVAYATALMVMISLHEFAHGLSGLALGLQPTVFAGHVSYAVAGTAAQQVTTALAGPVFSLALGLALLALPARHDYWGLLVLWLGALDVQEFNGYLMTGPFVPFGDVGQALRLLSAPAPVYAAVLVAGAAGTLLLGRLVTRRLLALTDPDGAALGTQLRSLGLFAWLLGTALVVVAGLPDSRGLLTPVGFFEVLGALTSGIFLFAVRLFMGREHVPGRGLAVGWPWAGLAVLVAVALLRLVVLGPGVRL